MKPKHQPYYAVIFTSTLKKYSSDYELMSNLMEELAKKQDGFLGMNSARDETGITVSYWRDKSSIKKWKSHTQHVMAQKRGIKDWYSWYNVKICVVEREYELS